MYDPLTARWNRTDPYYQFHSPYMAMGNNPVIYVDSDGRWVHIVAGAVIGAGAAIVKMALEPGDIDWTSGRTWAKIGTGAVTGAAIAAMPVSAIGVIGAGTTAFVGDVADQGIDVHYGYKQTIDLKQAAVSGVVTAVTAGVGGALSQNLVKHGREVFHATGKVPWYRLYPNLNAAAVNSTFDVTRFIIENRVPIFDEFSLFNYNFNEGDNLVRGVTPWGYEYAVPRGKTVTLPEIVVTPDDN